MEAAVAAATVAVVTVAKEANQVVITKAGTAEVAVAAMEAAVEAVTIKVDMGEVVAAATVVVAAAMAVAEGAATAVVDNLRRENSRRHGAAVATVEVAVAVAATEEAIVVAEAMVEETKSVEAVVEEGTQILKEVPGEEVPEVPSILRIIMKATRMEVEEVVETNSIEMLTPREHLGSSNSTLAARGRCRSKTLRGLSSSISVSTLRKIKVYFRPRKASPSLLNAGRG